MQDPLSSGFRSSVSRQGAAIKKRNVEVDKKESARNVAKHEFRVRS